jgi:hypothetical protein
MPKNKSPTQPGWDLPSALVELLAKPFPQSLVEIPLAPCERSNSTKGKSKASQATTASTSNAFMKSMSEAHNLTENVKGATAHKSTQSALVDLFFDFTNGVAAKHLFDLLDKSWAEDPTS